MTIPRKIKTVSHILSTVALVALILLPIIVAVSAALSVLPADLRAAAGLGPEDQPSRLLMLAIYAVGAAPLLIYLFVLSQLRALMACYIRGDILTPDSAGHIQRMGKGVSIAAIVGLITTPLQITLASFALPEGQRVLSLHFGSADLGLFLAGGVLLTIGWVMTEAAIVADENRGFV